MRFLIGFLSAIFLVVVIVVAFALYSVRHAALDEAGALESGAISQGKMWFIPEDLSPPPPEKTEQAILDGGEHFNHHCAVCHDLNGDADSLFAESFFPRVSNLSSDRVQSYSDGQLKWIVDNGIRYTGMPGWAMVIDDEVQWKIVHYIRVMKDPQEMEKFEELLRQEGKWKIEVPTGDHSEEEEHTHEQPGGDEHEHAEQHGENQGSQEAQE